MLSRPILSECGVNREHACMRDMGMLCLAFARSVNENKPSPIQEKGARTKEQEGWVCAQKDSMTEKGRGGGEKKLKDKDGLGEVI